MNTSIPQTFCHGTHMYQTTKHNAKYTTVLNVNQNWLSPHGIVVLHSLKHKDNKLISRHYGVKFKKCEDFAIWISKCQKFWLFMPRQIESPNIWHLYYVFSVLRNKCLYLKIIVIYLKIKAFSIFKQRYIIICVKKSKDVLFLTLS